eukprot:8728751-Ditylum_brightwellii.AAC.1
MKQFIIAHVSQVKTALGRDFTTHIKDMSDHLKEIPLFINNLSPLRLTKQSSGSGSSSMGSNPSASQLIGV